MNIIINLHTRKTRNNTTITFNMIFNTDNNEKSFNTSNLQDIKKKNTFHESQAKEHYWWPLQLATSLALSAQCLLNAA